MCFTQWRWKILQKGFTWITFLNPQRKGVIHLKIISHKNGPYDLYTTFQVLIHCVLHLNGVKSLVFKPQGSKTHLNDKLSWRRSTAMSRECNRPFYFFIGKNSTQKRRGGERGMRSANDLEPENRTVVGALPTKLLASIQKFYVNYWTIPLQMYECYCIYI